MTALAVGLGPGALASQAQDAEPAAAFRAFWAAIRAGRSREAAALLATEPLEALRLARVGWARNEKPEGLTVEGLMARDPEMPRAAAEYQLRQIERARARSASDWKYDFAGYDSLAALERAPVAELATAWLRAHDPFSHALRLAAASNCQVSPNDSAFRAFLVPAVDVLSAVVVSDRKAYLFFQQREGGPETPPVVAELRRTDDGWRVVPRNELLMDRMGLAGIGCRSSR